MLREIRRGSRKSRAVQGVEAGDRARAHMRKAGATPRGHRLWTDREDAIMRRFYPDYRVLERKLPARTYDALRARALTLGIQKQRHVWKGFEVARLRKLYPAGTRAEIMAIVPTVTWIATSCRARRAGARRIKRYKRTGFPILDAIRQRCLDLNLTMVDLDAVARTGSYFSRAAWHSSNTLSGEKLKRAVAALDGVMTIEWRKRA